VVWCGVVWCGVVWCVCVCVCVVTSLIGTSRLEQLRAFLKKENSLTLEWN